MQFGKIGNDDGQFNKPKDIAIHEPRTPNSELRIYIADRNNNRVQVFTYEGTGGKLMPQVVKKEKIDEPLRILEFYNYPNPFAPGSLNRPETNIYVKLTTCAKLEIIVYDVIGRLVKTTDTVFEDEGKPTTDGYYEYEIKWNGRNNRGDICANGVYLIYLQATTPNAGCPKTDSLIAKCRMQSAKWKSL